VQVEGPNSSEFDEHELDNLGSKEEVERTLQKGPSSGIKFLEFPESLADKDAELSFCKKMLEFMGFVKRELKRVKQERACQDRLIECFTIQEPKSLFLVKNWPREHTKYPSPQENQAFMTAFYDCG
jgi:hypothetical protein